MGMQSSPADSALLEKLQALVDQLPDSIEVVVSQPDTLMAVQVAPVWWQIVLTVVPGFAALIVAIVALMEIRVTKRVARAVEAQATAADVQARVSQGILDAQAPIFEIRIAHRSMMVGPVRKPYIHVDVTCLNKELRGVVGLLDSAEESFLCREETIYNFSKHKITAGYELPEVAKAFAESDHPSNHIWGYVKVGDEIYRSDNDLELPIVT